MIIALNKYLPANFPDRPIIMTSRSDGHKNMKFLRTEKQRAGLRLEDLRGSLAVQAFPSPSQIPVPPGLRRRPLRGSRARRLCSASLRRVQEEEGGAGPGGCRWISWSRRAPRVIMSSRNLVRSPVSSPLSLSSEPCFSLLVSSFCRARFCSCRSALGAE